jgi:hypothetical protein
MAIVKSRALHASLLIQLFLILCTFCLEIHETCCVVVVVCCCYGSMALDRRVLHFDSSTHLNLLVFSSLPATLRCGASETGPLGFTHSNPRCLRAAWAFTRNIGSPGHYRRSCPAERMAHTTPALWQSIVCSLQICRRRQEATLQLFRKRASRRMFLVAVASGAP